MEFYANFARIHPFQDGNGGVGRLIAFKECLKNNIVPFIILDIKIYYRGLKNWNQEPGCLIDTCLDDQDTVKEYLDYFSYPALDKWGIDEETKTYPCRFRRKFNTEIAVTAMSYASCSFLLWRGSPNIPNA